jgi:hypothetical protein
MPVHCAFHQAAAHRIIVNGSSDGVVWAGGFHPDPNPKPDVQVSKHPAFRMVLYSFCPEPTLNFLYVHREASRFNEPFGRPARIILHPFAM